jgi:hypothetical protein
VLDEAITQLPARHRRNLLITCDGAGATLDLVRHLTTLNTAPGRRVHCSVGFDLDARGRTAISQLADTEVIGRHRAGSGLDVTLGATGHELVESVPCPVLVAGRAHRELADSVSAPEQPAG